MDCRIRVQKMASYKSECSTTNYIDFYFQAAPSKNGVLPCDVDFKFDENI